MAWTNMTLAKIKLGLLKIWKKEQKNTSKQVALINFRLKNLKYKLLPKLKN
jgi:hypothetical protein